MVNIEGNASVARGVQARECVVVGLDVAERSRPAHSNGLAVSLTILSMLADLILPNVLIFVGYRVQRHGPQVGKQSGRAVEYRHTSSCGGSLAGGFATRRGDSDGRVRLLKRGTRCCSAGPPLGGVISMSSDGFKPPARRLTGVLRLHQASTAALRHAPSHRGFSRPASRGRSCIHPSHQAGGWANASFCARPPRLWA
jgi:hypothetical protein